MITQHAKSYECQHSSVQWLGNIPAHWVVRRFKFLLEEREKRSSNGSEQLLRVSQYTGVTQRIKSDGGSGPDTRAGSLVGYKCVKSNDLVINIMLAWNGSMGVSRFNGIASPAYCVYRFIPSANPWYFHYLLRSPIYKARIKAMSTGVVESRLRLYTDDLFSIEAIIPPLAEQNAIVRYLDYMDRRIGRYIRAKQKLIKLLEEQRQAIIHQAVTRGLDPTVRLKPSGVEWLGDVPEHWEVKRLKWVTKLQRGYDLPAEQRVQGPFPVVSSGGVIDRHQFFKSKAPGVVMGRYGSTDAVFFLEEDFWPHNTSLFVTDFQGNDAKWCYYMLRTISKADHAGKSAVPGVDRKDLFQILIAVPPANEQKSIVSILEFKLELFESGIRDAKQVIAYIQEYRTRLFADIVSGKLDVRDAVKHLPFESDDIEPLAEPDELMMDDEMDITESDGIEEEVDA
jgi:type I restriction enzyme S subunit